MKQFFLIMSLLFCGLLYVQAQDKPENWTLRNSIDYALENNIQIKRSKLSMEMQEETQKQVRANMFPTLSASASETFNNKQVETPAGSYEYQQAFTGNYSVNSNLTLFNGFRIQNSIKQQNLLTDVSELAVKEVENNIEIAITEAYLQILYAEESVKAAERTLEYSEAQMQRGELLYKAGSLGQSDYAQLVSQYSSDKYSLIMTQNTLDNQLLSFKQLLELDIDEDTHLYYPDLNDDDVITLLPTKHDVYETALSFMPQIKSSKINIQSAEYDLKMAKGNMYPTLNLNAGISTGYASIDSGSFATKLGNNFGQNIGLTLGINIFNHRETKTSIAKSKLAIEDARLNATQTEKDLLQTIESIYLDVVSSQNRFYAAKEALNAARTSYELTEKKFNLGMKNTVEFLNEKNSYTNAQQEYLQAKYATILYQKLLDFYQNKQITL